MPAHLMKHSRVLLRPDPSRTVIRPFAPGDPDGYAVKDHPRSQRIAARVLAMDDAKVAAELGDTLASLSERHRDVEAMLMRRFEELDNLRTERGAISRERALLIGAYFSEEYSFEAAALFNPSIVLARDQTDAPEGGIRFTMSLRGIGEGHVSSVTFRTGSWTPGGKVQVDPPSRWAVPPRIQQDDDPNDETVRLHCEGSEDISETVLFPILDRQRQGIEDLRLCRFVEDDGDICFYGTYTAFSGAAVRQEILHGHDFRTVEMRPIEGSIANGKGAALFPRKIGGRYAMLARQDSENVWLLMSDDLYKWDGGAKLIEPRYPWEFIQVGNCGSPIEIDEGWLVLTHGVGRVRNYCMGACLLDKDDPSKLLGRMEYPLLEPSAKERDGYVPNVVYSCGGLVHDRTLLLPYGVADNFATFATAKVDDILAAMR